jgi:TrmH RNA methyltransferase
VRRREGESKIYGVHACRAVFSRRPDDILKVFLTEERAKEMGPLLKHCAQQRRPYRIVPDGDLEKLTESRHHEGICIVARTRPTAELAEVFGEPGVGCVLALVDVSNPHNIGAILRSAAHFGARAVVLPGAQARLPAAAARTAQGGAEWLEVVYEPDLHRILVAARAGGFNVAATGSRGGRDLYATRLPPRLLLLLGSEDEGLPREILSAAEEILSVPGTGHVDSLNVAAASAVLLGEFWRQHRPAGR